MDQSILVIVIGCEIRSASNFNIDFQGHCTSYTIRLIACCFLKTGKLLKDQEEYLKIISACQHWATLFNCQRN